MVSLLGGADVVTMVSHDIVGRMMTMAARQPGLASVFDSVLGFDGDEFYMESWPEFTGLHFGQLPELFPCGILCGVCDEFNRIVLNPPAKYIIKEMDELVVIAEDSKSNVSVPDLLGILSEEHRTEQTRRDAETDSRRRSITSRIDGTRRSITEAVKRGVNGIDGPPLTDSRAFGSFGKMNSNKTASSKAKRGVRHLASQDASNLPDYSRRSLSREGSADSSADSSAESSGAVNVNSTPEAVGESDKAKTKRFFYTKGMSMISPAAEVDIVPITLAKLRVFCNRGLPHKSKASASQEKFLIVGWRR
jgi:hypothetical protein